MGKRSNSNKKKRRREQRQMLLQQQQHKLQRRQQSHHQSTARRSDGDAATATESSNSQHADDNDERWASSSRTPLHLLATSPATSLSTSRSEKELSNRRMQHNDYDSYTTPKNTREQETSPAAVHRSNNNNKKEDPDTRTPFGTAIFGRQQQRSLPNLQFVYPKKSHSNSNHMTRTGAPRRHYYTFGRSSATAEITEPSLSSAARQEQQQQQHRPQSQQQRQTPATGGAAGVSVVAKTKTSQQSIDDILYPKATILPQSQLDDHHLHGDGDGDDHSDGNMNSNRSDHVSSEGVRISGPSLPETTTQEKAHRNKDTTHHHTCNTAAAAAAAAAASTSALSAPQQQQQQHHHHHHHHHLSLARSPYLSGVSVEEAVRDKVGLRPRSNSTDGELNLPQRGLCDERKVLETFRWKSHICRIPPRGFKNLGNTCFLNSTLQCLAYCPPFCQSLLEMSHNNNSSNGNHQKANQGKKITMLLSTFFRQVHGGSHNKRNHHSFGGASAAISPHGIVNAVPSLGSHGTNRNGHYKFRPGRQEDAHEFLVHLLDAMHDGELREAGIDARKSGWRDRLPVPRLDETTFVHRIFGGYLRSQVRCTACGYRSNTYDPFLDLSLEISRKSCQSIASAFLEFTRKERLDSENRWKCSGCKKRVCATKQLTVFRPPLSLCIQLKRFAFGGTFGGHFVGFGGHMMGGKKISKPIDFPANLKLPLSDGRSCEYALTGIVIHIGGSPSSGHYTACVKRPGRNGVDRWFHMDDSYVQAVSERDVLRQKDAYVLLYSRKEVKLEFPSPPLRGSMTTAEAREFGRAKARARADSLTTTSTSSNKRLSGSPEAGHGQLPSIGEVETVSVPPHAPDGPTRALMFSSVEKEPSKSERGQVVVPSTRPEITRAKGSFEFIGPLPRPANAADARERSDESSASSESSDSDESGCSSHGSDKERKSDMDQSSSESSTSASSGSDSSSTDSETTSSSETSSSKNRSSSAGLRGDFDAKVKIGPLQNDFANVPSSGKPKPQRDSETSSSGETSSSNSTASSAEEQSDSQRKSKVVTRQNGGADVPRNENPRHQENSEASSSGATSFSNSAGSSTEKQSDSQMKSRTSPGQNGGPAMPRNGKPRPQQKKSITRITLDRGASGKVEVMMGPRSRIRNSWQPRGINGSKDAGYDLLGNLPVSKWDDSESPSGKGALHGRSEIIRKVKRDERQRKRKMHLDRYDSLLDQGKIKKVKQKKTEIVARPPSANDFQRIQAIVQKRNKGRAKGHHLVPNGRHR